MPGKKKKQPAQQSAAMRWEFDPSIPTDDFFEGCNLDRAWDLQEAVGNFIYGEQGLPLTAKQKDALGSLISFNEETDDRILYINEIPRPSEPWYVILNKLVPHLQIEPFRTFDVHQEVKSDGWRRIMTALEEHGEGLSLPPGVTSLREVVPEDLRHKLWLQYCFDILGGLGQDDDLILEKEDPWRVDEFIVRLRECKESVAHFGLSLESLSTKVILPERDRPIFFELVQDKLGLRSAREPIADRL
jgi:hypothetical protein